MVQLKFTTIDVFTTERYAGNPLAIVALPADVTITQEQKQQIAREFNYSETVILHMPEEGSKGPIKIDIFIVNAEIRFAGHPTIGTICMLSTYPGFAKMTDRESGRGSVLTKAGLIPYRFDESGMAWAEIPHDVHVHEQKLDRELLQACGVTREISAKVVQSVVVSIVKGMTFALLELPDLATLSEVTVDSWISKTEKLKLDSPWYNNDLLGTYFYVKHGDSNGRISVSCRMCFDNIEDPATGSAACALSAYLSLATPGEYVYEIEQGKDMGRRSIIATEITTKDGQVSKLVLGGTGIPVMKGSIEV